MDYPQGAYEAFTYGKVGNRLTHTTDQGVSRYTINGLNQVIESRDETETLVMTQKYDTNGNLTQKSDLINGSVTNRRTKTT